MQRHVDSLYDVMAQSYQRARTHREDAVRTLFIPSTKPRLPVSPTMPVNPSAAAANLRSSLLNEANYAQSLDLESRKFQVEIHKKYAIPFACVVFVFIGAPLGILARRGTFGAGASLSLGFFLLYWTCLIQGERFADRGLLDPWLAMWMANIIIGVLGVLLTIRTARDASVPDLSRFRIPLPRFFRSRAPKAGSA
jgi:lipopolysaccharide export LptBFGC system permease protein LptF